MQYRCKKCNLQGTTFKTSGLVFVLLTASYYAVAELKESLLKQLLKNTF